MNYLIEKIRNDFPIFTSAGAPLIYLDNAATSQKPQAVIERISSFYRRENANIHRGSYPLSDVTGRNFEFARETVRRFIGAEKTDEIVFTKSSTESINLVAYALADMNLGADTNIVVTELEHSSNYFPWMNLCRKSNIEFRVAAAEIDGTLPAENVISEIDLNTELVAVTGMSNTTGFIPDLKKIIAQAHQCGALVLVDGTQMIVHDRINVQEIDCDFLAFSGHKLYGPMGIGVLYGKECILRKLPPFLYGGDMVQRGDGDNIVYRTDPGKYEAGTQNIAGAVGLEAAINYLEQEQFMKLLLQEQAVAQYMHQTLRSVPGVHVLGTEELDTSPLVMFTVDGFGSYDVGVYLGLHGVCIRCGSHCAYPLMKRLRLQDSCRASLGIYNTIEDVNRMAELLENIRKVELP